MFSYILKLDNNYYKLFYDLKIVLDLINDHLVIDLYVASSSEILEIFAKYKVCF